METGHTLGDRILWYKKVNGGEPDMDPVLALYSDCCGGLAQLARAPALQAGGQRFESVILHLITNIDILTEVERKSERKSWHICARLSKRRR